MKADSETSAKALRNSKAVADKNYIKPTTVLPNVLRAVNEAFSGLADLNTAVCNGCATHPRSDPGYLN
jgi:hypothetical protein